jgi:hypothetical protein
MSKTIIGLVITIIGLLAKWFSWNVPGQEELDQFLTALLTLIGIALAWYGRVRKGDVTWYGARKSPTSAITIESL